MHKLTGLLAVVVLAALFAACGSTTVNVGTDACTVDTDCVPTTCCHATECGAPVKGKACNVACTADCKAGTIDCGGGCLCQSGHCAAHVID